MIFILMFISLSSSIWAQPDWVSGGGISVGFPTSTYITGFGICKVTDSVDKIKARAMALEIARGNLAEKVLVTISNNITSKKEESDARVSEYFSNVTQSRSTLHVTGLQEKAPYYDEDEEQYYALVYAERENLINSYTDNINQLALEIKNKTAAGKKLEQDNNNEAALKEYLSCLSLYSQYDEMAAIRKALSTDAVLMLEESEQKQNIQEFPPSIGGINESIARIVNRPIKTIEDVIWYIVHCLDEKIGHGLKKVMVDPFVYADTRMSGSFSRYCRESLEQSFAVKLGWDIIKLNQNSIEQTLVLSSGQKPDQVCGHIVSGSFWEQGDKVVCKARCVSTAENKIIAGVEFSFDKKILETAGMSLKPQNYQEALIDQKIFAQGEIIDGGLRVEVMTNKGADNIIFNENDSMRVFLRVNLPCHIRLIYHQADGARVLLLDDLFIDEAKVNKWFNPQGALGTFICAAPFGAEVLQVNAQTAEFDKLETKHIDDLAVIIGDLKEAVNSTRGMKKMTNMKMRAETRIVMTTMGER